MPRKYQHDRSADRDNNLGFNEAGADAPEIPLCLLLLLCLHPLASMRPGRMPRKYQGIGGLSCGQQELLQ